MTVTTLPGYSHYQVWWTTRSHNWQVLQVQACHDAHVLLSNSPENVDNVYEIALGIKNNTESVIRRGFQGGNEVTAQTPGILHCDELRTFWIRWSADVIEVGYGRKVGEELFMIMTNTPLGQSITSLSVSTGWGSTGVWNTNSVTGMYQFIL